MRYEKPNMEIISFDDKEVLTVTIVSGDGDIGDGSGIFGQMEM